jgi:sterol desaturase/sphingolipid hydroxylase (fatty acid hydroxylase superfamily)
MEELILHNEAVMRSVQICALIVLVGLWEVFGTSRATQASVHFRWLNHLGLLIINDVVARVAISAFAIAAAIAVAEKGWGLFNAIDMPLWFVFPVTVIMLDLGNYSGHWLMHKVPLLWRVHRVHHSDIDVDWSTAFRIHPVEAIITFGLRAIVIVLLGAPPIAIAVYEIAFVFSAFFVHANVIMPPSMERKLRALVITPDMHRIHHSIDMYEANCNFGAIFSFLDRCFKTYCAQPQLGHKDMLLGLAEYRDGKEQNLLWLLKLPFEPSKALLPPALEHNGSSHGS